MRGRFPVVLLRDPPAWDQFSLQSNRNRRSQTFTPCVPRAVPYRKCVLTLIQAQKTCRDKTNLSCARIDDFWRQGRTIPDKARQQTHIGIVVPQKFRLPILKLATNRKLLALSAQVIASTWDSETVFQEVINNFYWLSERENNPQRRKMRSEEDTESDSDSGMDESKSVNGQCDCDFQVYDCNQEAAFLTTLQHLLQIDPTNSLTDTIWDTVEKLVYRCTMMEHKQDAEKMLLTGAKRLEKAIEKATLENCHCTCHKDQLDGRMRRDKAVSPLSSPHTGRHTTGVNSGAGAPPPPPPPPPLHHLHREKLLRRPLLPLLQE